MEIEVLGAGGGEVTGSAYLITNESSRVLVDFGMFQGAEEVERLNQLPQSLRQGVDAVVLTHAHLDHVGRLPLLTKFARGVPIYATGASIQMAGLILQDSAQLQLADAERRNRRSQGGLPVEPLYTVADVQKLAGNYRELPYNQSLTVAPGISVRAVDAGHMLGSVSLQFSVAAGNGDRTVVFSGDIGQRDSPILRDPVGFKSADLVIMESTYGDRDHRGLRETIEEANQIIRQAVIDRGKILVPVFAVGRAQLLLYLLAGAFQRGLLEPFPIYLDSPMAVKATQIYAENVELFDDEALTMYRSGQLSKHLRTVKASVSVQDSMALNDINGPCMILAGSGMCTGGRILHHLRHNLASPSTVVLIVGFQSHGSLGRRLVDGAPMVRMFGEEIPVRASIRTLGGFSAHAGQSELLRWAEPLARGCKRFVLTHGEDPQRRALAAELSKRFGVAAELPALGQRITL